MENISLKDRFIEIGEYGAAGFYEEEDRSLFYRRALGVRRFYENRRLPKYTGQPLYPSGSIYEEEMGVYPSRDDGLGFVTRGGFEGN